MNCLPAVLIFYYGAQRMEDKCFQIFTQSTSNRPRRGGGQRIQMTKSLGGGACKGLWLNVCAFWPVNDLWAGWAFGDPLVPGPEQDAPQRLTCLVLGAWCLVIFFLSMTRNLAMDWFTDPIVHSCWIADTGKKNKWCSVYVAPELSIHGCIHLCINTTDRGPWAWSTMCLAESLSIVMCVAGNKYTGKGHSPWASDTVALTTLFTVQVAPIPAVLQSLTPEYLLGSLDIIF